MHEALGWGKTVTKPHAMPPTARDVRLFVGTGVRKNQDQVTPTPVADTTMHGAQ